MSDEEAVDPVVDPVVPIVEIKGGSEGRQQPWRSGDYEDDFDEDESDRLTGSDLDTDPDDHVEPRATGSARPSSRRSKTVNGKRAVDMTPPDQKLKTCRKRAEKFSDAGKADKAISEYIKCNALARVVYGSFHWRYAESFVSLAEAYLDLKGYVAQAEYHGQNAKSVVLHGDVHTSGSETETAEIYLVLLRTYFILGRALTALKKYGEAEQCLVKANRVSGERARLSCVTQDDSDKVDVLLSEALAKLYGKQKKYALATAEYDRCLELIEIVYGQDSLRLIPIHQAYGRLEQSKGRHANHERAIEHYLQAHSIAAAHYREGSKELVDTTLALAQAYANTGREDAESSAESYLNECLSTCTVVYGPEHARTLEVQDELARLLVRTDRHQEALTMLKSSLTSKCQVFGDYSEQVSDTHKLMASVYLSQGNIEKALQAYKKCYAIEELVLGKKHRKTKDTLRTMELLLASPGVSQKFVLNEQQKLQKRPRFSSIVKGSQPLGGCKPPP